MVILRGLDILAEQLKADEHTAQVTTVHDGDTFTANIYLDFDIWLTAKQVRIYQFDAWEISRVRKTVIITEAELIKGREAKLYLESLFAKAKRITIEPAPTKDPYGRLLGIVRVDGQLLSDLLRSKGYERRNP